MNPEPTGCLVLACGNTLRSDDGVGPWLCERVEIDFEADPEVRVIARQQWTPDLAEDIAASRTVIFVDCTLDAPPGQVALREVKPSSPTSGLATHHTGAAELLSMASQLYGAVPHRALLLTVGAGSMALGESFSPAVRNALPDARNLLELTILQLLRSSTTSNLHSQV